MPIADVTVIEWDLSCWVFRCGALGVDPPPTWGEFSCPEVRRRWYPANSTRTSATRRRSNIWQQADNALCDNTIQCEFSSARRSIPRRDMSQMTMRLTNRKVRVKSSNERLCLTSYAAGLAGSDSHRTQTHRSVTFSLSLRTIPEPT